MAFVAAFLNIASTSISSASSQLSLFTTRVATAIMSPSSVTGIDTECSRLPTMCTQWWITTWSFSFFVISVSTTSGTSFITSASA